MKNFERFFKLFVAMTLALTIVGCYVDHSRKNKADKAETEESRGVDQSLRDRSADNQQIDQNGDV